MTAPERALAAVAAIGRLVIRDDIFAAIGDERARQDVKWGPQHYPPTIPPLRTLPSERYVTGHYNLPTAGEARRTCDRRAKAGTVTWGDIATEEFCEMIEAFGTGNMEAGRVEAIQTIAVLVAMLEDLDTRET